MRSPGKRIASIAAIAAATSTLSSTRASAFWTPKPTLRRIQSKTTSTAAPGVARPFCNDLRRRSATRSILPTQSIYPRSLSIILLAANEQGTDDGDDEELLNSVSVTDLQNLCKRFSVSPEGTKEELLFRLRAHAEDSAAEDRDRRRRTAARVEAGSDAYDGGREKAQHRILEDGGASASASAARDDDEMEGYFYFPSPESAEEAKAREERERREKITRRKKAEDAKTQGALDSRDSVTSPLPPQEVLPNADGERVVTLYSTTDRNDLTGGGDHTLPGGEMGSGMANTDMPGMMGGYSRTGANAAPEDGLAGGPFGDGGGSRRRKIDEGELEAAKEIIEELVKNLLATTGAPAFQDQYLEEDNDGDVPQQPAFASPNGFEGFRPDRIPADALSQSSRALRTAGGEALKEVLSNIEIEAIGHDGYAADDRSKGGGHYREVEKVGTFLEGYRRAEDRGIARETATMLLDKLVKEGVRGLDGMLFAMAKGEGSGSGDAGELNDALVVYLDGAIREQELRVEQTAVLREDTVSATADIDAPADVQWNVTRGEDGVVVESIDPSDPVVRRTIVEEIRKNGGKNNNYLGLQNDPAGMTVQDKMLLLLTLLRDRVKVEAAVGNDERSRNLRILAYCLKVQSDEERQTLIMEELGMSLDKLDDFSDLVVSSIDYAESRTEINDDFQPSSQRGVAVSPLLQVKELKRIRDVAERIKETQSWKASGATTYRDNIQRP